MGSGKLKSAIHTFTCEVCGVDFKAKLDHGNARRFCSRECFCNQKGGVVQNCANCGTEFKARLIDGERRKYCSKKCRGEDTRKGTESKCVVCGKQFYVTEQKIKKGTRFDCCSQECRNKYYVNENSLAYKRGWIRHSQTCEVHVLMPREGYVSKYRGEHRIIAENIIGRELQRGEYVIRIDRSPDNNEPENLFVCRTNSEFSKRRQGSLPWPMRSNLEEYK